MDVVDDGEASPGPVEDVAHLLAHQDRDGDAVGDDARYCQNVLFGKK